jgi:hypothetical protein
MALSASTLQLLGCTSTPEDLASALAEARSTNVDWEQYYVQQQQAQRPVRERFREFKEGLAIATVTSGAIVSTEILSSASVKERFRKYEMERDKREHSTSVLLGRKRSRFSV